MEWEQILTELVRFVRDAAPPVWEIYRRQVVIVSVQYTLWALVFCGIGFLSFKTGNAAMKKYKEVSRDCHSFSTGDVAAYLMWAIAALLSAIAFAFASDTIGRLINPDYYVIQMMLSAVGAR